MAEEKINGRTYNTFTAKKVAEKYSVDNNCREHYNTLYRKRTGEYFLHVYRTDFYCNEIYPLTAEEVEIVNEFFANDNFCDWFISDIRKENLNVRDYYNSDRVQIAVGKLEIND